MKERSPEQEAALREAAKCLYALMADPTPSPQGQGQGLVLDPNAPHLPDRASDPHEFDLHGLADDGCPHHGED